MKTTFSKVSAALGLACVILIFTAALLRDTGLSGFAPSPLSLRNNFYFCKRQWLADARTLTAAVRYLYQTRSSSFINSSNIANNPFLSFPEIDDSTNLLGLEEFGTAILLHERRLTRADSLIIRTRLVCSYDLAAADLQESNGVGHVNGGFSRFIPQPTNTALPTMERFSRALPVSGA